MSTPVVKLNTIEIPVADLERAVAWYRDALGLACTWSDEHHATLSSAEGGVQVLLVATRDPTRLSFESSVTGLRHAVVDFETPDLERLHAHLDAHGADPAPLEPPANDWAPRGFAFHDSEGNRLAAFCYTH